VFVVTTLVIHIMDMENLQLKVLTLMKENIDKENRIRELEQKLVCIKQLINLTACTRCGPGFESAWKSIDILSGNPESFDPKPEENQVTQNGNTDKNITSPTLELDSDSEEPEDNLEPSQTSPLENINIDLTDATSFEKYKRDFIDSKNQAQVPSPKEKSKFFCTYTKEQLKWLNSRFEYGQFLGRGEARRVAPVLNLSVRQVTNWFSNQRRKIYLAKTKDSDNKLSDLPTLLPDVNGDVSIVKNESPKIQLPELPSQKDNISETGEINPTEFIQEKSTSFTPEALEELRERFARNPYLLSGEAEFFAAKFSLTKRQITNWFSNNRRSNGLLQSKKIFDQISSLEKLKETDISSLSLDNCYEPPVKIAKI